jgi:hypothetical protein
MTQEVQETVLVVARVQSVTHKRNQAGNTYLEMDLVEEGRDFERKYRQWNNLETSGELCEICNGPDYAGDAYFRFSTYTRPAGQGRFYHNIDKVLGLVSLGSEVSDSGSGVIAEPPAPPPAPPMPNEPTPSPIPTPPTRPPSSAPSVAQNGHREPYIPGLDKNSNSIQRQVSVKSGIGGDSTGMLELRVRVLEAAYSSSLAFTHDPQEDPLGLHMMDTLWAWVVGRKGATGYADDIAQWLEFGVHSGTGGTSA